MGEDIDLPADSTKFGVVGPDHQKSDTGQEGGPGAHEAGFEGDDECALLKSPVARGLAGLTESKNFSMGCGIVVFQTVVPAPSHDGQGRLVPKLLGQADYHGSNGNFPGLGGQVGLLQSAGHPGLKDGVRDGAWVC